METNRRRFEASAASENKQVATWSRTSRIPPPVSLSHTTSTISSRHICSIQASMSLDNFFDSLVANTTTANEDQDLFEKYLNLDEYDYKYSELPNPLPPAVVHPTAPSSAVYSDTSYPNGSVAAPWIPNAPSTPLATPIDGSLSLLHHQATDNGICNFQAPHPASSPAQNRLNGSAPLAGASTCLFCGDSHVPRPTGLGTTSTYWNTRQATYIAGHDTVDVVTPCLDRHACMAMVSSNPQSLTH